MFRLFVLFSLLLNSQFLHAVEITLLPEGKVYLNPTDPDKGFSDLVLHSVLVSTNSDEVFELDDLRIDLLGDTGDSATVHLHFQMNNGADVFASKNLPVGFSNLQPVQ